MMNIVSCKHLSSFDQTKERLLKGVEVYGNYGGRLQAAESAAARE